MRGILIAISFFTRIPIKINNVTEDEFYDSMIFMPIVGLFVGAVLYGLSWLFKFIQNGQLEAILMIIFYIAITGGLHFDGVADTVDGVFSARDHDRMMEIMKDSRLGSFGAIGLILLFLTLYSSYTVLMDQMRLAFLFLPLVGRYCAIQSCCFSTYAKGGGGLGKRIVEQTKVWHVVLYLAVIAVGMWFAAGPRMLLAYGLTIVANFILMAYLNKRIGGLTGDGIGLTIEVSQAFFAVFLVILLVNNVTLAGWM